MKFKFEEVEGGILPVRSTKSSAGFDCFSNRQILIKSGEISLIPLGFRISDFGREGNNISGQGTSPWISLTHLLGDLQNLPYLELHLRSSLRIKGISSGGVGIIDADYRDEVKLVFMNNSPDEYRMECGEKIAQIIVTQTPVFCISNLETLSEERNGGFGSTGS